MLLGDFSRLYLRLTLCLGFFNSGLQAPIMVVVMVGGSEEGGSRDS